MQQCDQDQEQKFLLVLVLVCNIATHLAPSSHRLRPAWSRNTEDGKRRWRLKKCEAIEEDENEEKDEYKEAVEGKHDDKKEEEGNDKVNENDDDDWMEENVGKENNITLNNP